MLSSEFCDGAMRQTVCEVLPVHRKIHPGALFIDLLMTFAHFCITFGVQNGLSSYQYGKNERYDSHNIGSVQYSQIENRRKRGIDVGRICRAESYSAD